MGRLAHDSRHRKTFAVGERLRAVGEELGTTPARLAPPFALLGPRVASVLFGATAPAQVADNVGALKLLERISEEELAELRGIAA